MEEEAARRVVERLEERVEAMAPVAEADETAAAAAECTVEVVEEAAAAVAAAAAWARATGREGCVYHDAAAGHDRRSSVSWRSQQHQIRTLPASSQTRVDSMRHFCHKNGTSPD